MSLSVINRFGTNINSGWGYSSKVDAIQFSTSHDILLFAVGLYGGSDNRATVTISRLNGDGTDQSKCDVVTTVEATKFDSLATTSISLPKPITILANQWHLISAKISGPRTYYGYDGCESKQVYGVVFNFRNALNFSTNHTSVTLGQIPELYFQLCPSPAESSKTVDTAESKNADLITEIEKLKIENSDLKQELIQSNKEAKETGQLRAENATLKQELIQSKMGALHCAKSTLKFTELEKVEKLLVCIQLQNGAILYFDNTKPFGLFTMQNGIRVTAQLKLLEGLTDCAFKGTIANHAYFSASRGKKIRFFKASIMETELAFEEVNELKTSDLIPFENQPLYFIEESREWQVYQCHQNYDEEEGEKFDISGLRSIRKFDCHYHRNVLYFFRENSTAKLEKLNDNVVIIEGPALDGALSFYTPPHSDCIYIANSDQNALLTLNTTNLHVSQQIYDPPIDSTYHSIVGIHEGILTMAFEGKGVGRCLMTTKLH